MSIRKRNIVRIAAAATVAAFIVPAHGTVGVKEIGPSFGPAQHKGRKDADKKKKKEAGDKADKTGEAEPTKAPALNFKMKDIDGKERSLMDFYGNVILMVNTASECGFTPQYAGLEELFQIYQPQHFVVLAFPANNFGGQEPGTNKVIKKFCQDKYAITFPLFGKVSVKGKDLCDLYKYLTSKDAGHKFGGDIPWNFNKFLISRKGEIIGRFKHTVHPTKSKKLIAAIEKALAEPVPSDSQLAVKEPPKPSMSAVRD